MNSLYKRIVTIGMVSITALLAWIYCIAAFPDKPVYIAGISLVLVVSVYALLNALTGLHIEKEKTLQTYITQTADDLVSKTLESNHSEETERLAKATYVQLRKSNTMLSNLSENINANHEQSIMAGKTQHDVMSKILTDTVNKATKIVVKYGETNTTNLIHAIDTMTEQLDELRQLITESTGTSEDVIDYSHILDNINYQILELKTAVEGIQSVSVSAAKETTFTTNMPVVEDTTVASDVAIEDSSVTSDVAIEDSSVTSDVAVEEPPVANDEFVIEDSATTENTANTEATVDMGMSGLLDQAAIDALINGSAAADDAEVPVEEPLVDRPVSEDSNKKLSDDEIAALFAAAAAPKTEPEPVAEMSKTEEVVSPDNNIEDANRKLSPEEIAALFAASQDERRALSDDDFKVNEHPEAMDHNLIDALLGLDEDETDTKLADVIPFPSANSTEESDNDISEAIASEPVSEDPNKKLSDDEIAALFAAATAPKKEPEPVKEPEPIATPVSEDSNKKLSDDEIAALFASMGN